MEIYKRIATVVTAIRNCEKSNNQEWLGRWEDQLEKLMRTAPSGSGIDSGTKIRIDAKTTRNSFLRFGHIAQVSTGERLIFDTSFHHMNDVGYYDGWTEHTVTVTGSLTSGYKMTISGRDRNDIKEYLYETFSAWLDETAPESDSI